MYKILLFSVSFIIICLDGRSQSMLVTTKITYTRPYCGGARPTQQILTEAEKTRPYPGKTIVIVSSTGKVDSVKTSKSGVFKARLKYGSYKLQENWRYYKCNPNGGPKNDFIDSCLKTEWELPIKIVIVNKKQVTITSVNEIIDYCFWNLPCLTEEKKAIRPE